MKCGISWCIIVHSIPNQQLKRQQANAEDQMNLVHPSSYAQASDRSDKLDRNTAELTKVSVKRIAFFGEGDTGE
jgi:hypothetical protein